MKPNLFAMATVLLITIFGSVSCGPEQSNEGKLEEAQSQFANHNYNAALIIFEQLISEDTLGITTSDAYIGAGWCKMRLSDLAGAAAYFAKASPSDPDGLGGWSLTLWGLNSPSSALTKANAALEQDAAWIFSLDDRITHTHLVWTQAACYWQLGNYAQAVIRLQVLDSGFNPSINDPYIAQIIFQKLESLDAAG